jgi:hypothetical protein
MIIIATTTAIAKQLIYNLGLGCTMHIIDIGIGKNNEQNKKNKN